jgi:DNA-binding PadR family transcriptional regulator
MARNRPLTPLAVAALALLTERDMHPYEMFTTMVQRHEDLVVKLRAGSLYHTVNRLADDGLVAAQGTDREGNRPERTTYAISPEGREILHSTVVDLLARPAEEYPRFPLALAEAHHVDRDLVVELLGARLHQTENKAAALRAGHARAATHVAQAHLLDIDYLAAMAEAEAAWLRGLLDRLRNGTLEWKVTCDDD